jgi:hypothetical protein
VFGPELAVEANVAGGALSEWYGERACHHIFSGSLVAGGYGVLDVPGRATTTTKRRARPQQPISQPSADRLDKVLAQGEPEQTKALLRILIAELRVNSKTDPHPTYRIVVPGACATSGKWRGPYVAQTPCACARRG